MCWNNLWVRAASSLMSLPVLGMAAATVAAETNSVSVVDINRLPKRAIVTLGEVSPSQSVNVSLTLRSDLGKPLSILSVASDCGCVRVDHDPNAVAEDGSPRLDVKLAASKKIGRIRRNIRVFFEQDPTSPLDVGLDTLVVGPITLNSAHVEVDSATAAVDIDGTKTKPGVEVLQCEPTRGSCRVLGIDQSSETFSVRAIPLVSFGTANEILRIRYRNSADSSEGILDLPLELRCVSPIRFFPSVTTIRFEDGAWRSVAKLVLAPGTPLDFEQLQVSIERDDGSLWDQSDFRVDVLQASVVLYAMHITCSATTQDSNRPARLKVASPNGELLAMLDFSSP